MDEDKKIPSCSNSALVGYISDEKRIGSFMREPSYQKVSWVPTISLMENGD